MTKNLVSPEEDDILLQKQPIIVETKIHDSNEDCNSEIQKDITNKLVVKDVIDFLNCKKILNIISISILITVIVIIPIILTTFSSYNLKDFYNIFKPKINHFQISIVFFIILWSILVSNMI